ncbi:hypothetical protein NPIL_510181 [Nephila pilipes]|uniref:Uncharacterized protein n=1 Tax=Nephila pilipes TaxID=299642 RepID=A0A8X6Q9R4_NEPPI|nr:hypothetical protein NPIL_510181 [Nephila pilipes]
MSAVRKTSVTIAFLLLTLLDLRWATFVVIRQCNANTDCKEDECCLQKPWSNRFFCAKRVREGREEPLPILCVCVVLNMKRI